MISPQGLIERAYSVLAGRPGFVERPDQRQISLLLADCIETGNTGAFEAPTGLGKSLACLIPAIACAMVLGKRIVIATYTNVLAEQYWRHDLPLALSLFEPFLADVEGDEGPPALPACQFLIGRTRYACLAAGLETQPALLRDFRRRAEMGIESEFRQLSERPLREQGRLWGQISAPPVCPGKLCEHYEPCFYYKARRQAERAHVVITNHSVVLQDALLRRASEGEQTMLGKVDFVIFDEAHDLVQAAQNGLEFELSVGKLATLESLANRLFQSVVPASLLAQASQDWDGAFRGYKSILEGAQRALAELGRDLDASGILAAIPETVWRHPQVQKSAIPERLSEAAAIATDVGTATLAYTAESRRLVTAWRDAEKIGGEVAKSALDAVRNYSTYLADYAYGCFALFDEPPEGFEGPGPLGPASVTHISLTPDRGPILRLDLIDFREPLRRLLWEVTPWACLSATLALDGNFEYFSRSTGAEPGFAEMLQTPFDFSSQAALYLPPNGRIPDPTWARKAGEEDVYYDALAKELRDIIRTMGGGVLALFHSRREMEAVYGRLDLDASRYPIYLQRTTGAATTGDRFRENVHSSLFALRSFWTGFDAPGETLRCVTLVRVPFEVPVEPAALARMAFLQTEGLDPFAAHTLPLAKMMMRQGAGRLIRRSDDYGVIALLDPRLRSKRYGEEILENLPSGMRAFDDIVEAAAHLGIAAMV